MKTSINIWDALFGEKVIVFLPMPNGGVKEVKVTKKWMDQMIREGKIKPVPSSSQSDEN